MHRLFPTLAELPRRAELAGTDLQPYDELRAAYHKIAGGYLHD